MIPKPVLPLGLATLPAIWRRYKVTVCIAAFAESEGQIVVVSDSKVAFGDFSADQGALKHEHLGNGYLILIAGNDVVYALPTIKRVKKRVAQTRDPEEIADIVHAELCEARNRVIEAKILKRYGMTVQQFLDRGRKSFTDRVFYEICSRIDREEISLQFLLAGFDENRVPHLRVISAHEPPNDFDSLGFAAIGSGASGALSSLSFAKDHLGFGRYSDMEPCAYHLLAAKYMAESATDVGRDTFFVSVGPKRGSYGLHTLGEEAIRKSWEKYGAPRHPKETIKILKDVLFPTDAYMSQHVLERCLKYGSGPQKKLFGIIVKAQKRKKLLQEQTAANSPKLSDPQTLEGRP
jgi:hypothetical protein